MSGPLFTHDDITRLRDIMETEHFDRQFQEYTVFMTSLADRLELWLDQEANTTRITPHPDWAKVRLAPIDPQKPLEQLPDGFRYRRIVVHDRMDGKRWESHQGSLDRETWVELKAICLGEAWNPPTYTVGYSMLVDETDLTEG